jgi:ubiquitin C-terminal hydrolase
MKLILDDQKLMERNTWKAGRGVGLSNQGNTCYANAGLQLLLHLPTIARTAIEVPHILENTPISLEMRHLIETYWNTTRYPS